MICFRNSLGVLENFQRVAVALRHLLAVDARHPGRGVQQLGLRQDERLAEQVVETGGQIAAHLDVLHLVLADRNGVGIVDQDIGRHQHGIGEQAGVGRQTLGLLVLEGVASLQQPHRRPGHQQPAQLGDLGHVGLHEQRGAIRIEPERQQVDGRVERVLRQGLAVADGRQRVQVGDEIEGAVGIALQFDVLPDGAEVVAPVESSRGLNAGKNAHGRDQGSGVREMMNDEW